MQGRDEVSSLEAELRKLNGALDELDALTQQVADEMPDPDEAETIVVTTRGSQAQVPANDHFDDDQDDFIEHHRQHGWLERGNR